MCSWRYLGDMLPISFYDHNIKHIPESSWFYIIIKPRNIPSLYLDHAARNGMLNEEYWAYIVTNNDRDAVRAFIDKHIDVITSDCWREICRNFCDCELFEKYDKQMKMVYSDVLDRYSRRETCCYLPYATYDDKSTPCREEVEEFCKFIKMHYDKLDHVIHKIESMEFRFIPMEFFLEPPMSLKTPQEYFFYLKFPFRKSESAKSLDFIDENMCTTHDIEELCVNRSIPLEFFNRPNIKKLILSEENCFIAFSRNKMMNVNFLSNYYGNDLTDPKNLEQLVACCNCHYTTIDFITRYIPYFNHDCWKNIASSCSVSRIYIESQISSWCPL